MKFPGDIVAHLSCAVGLNRSSTAVIYGKEGRIEVPTPWFVAGHKGGSSELVVHRNGEDPETIVIETDVYLYAGEADHVAEYLAARQGVFPAMSWDDTVGNMIALDRWRAAIGLQYEMEKPDNMTTPIYGRPLKRRVNHTMKYARLEGIDTEISRLVMGSTIGSFQQMSAVFDEYVESGGNTFDTAHVYGTTDASLGRWIRNRGIRDQVHVLAKGAHTPHCNPKDLTRQLLETLENLGTDYVDFYFMHRDNTEVPVSEFVDVLNEHRDAGRIRLFGGSNWSVERLEAANAYASANSKQGFSALSNNFSLARMIEPPWPACVSASEDSIRNWHEKTQFPLFAWSSQAQGFFVPSISGADKPDWAWGKCWYSSENFERQRRAIELAEKRGVIPTSIALAYVLHQPFPLFPLFCPHTALELGTSVEALTVELSDQDLKWLDLRA
jgi:aryl-alcohol dehydrogenase-like predicted oxidoreductase